VLQSEEQAVIVPAAERPPGDLAEPERLAHPLAEVRRIGELAGHRDPVVRDERAIVASRHDELARFELGLEEGVALGTLPGAALQLLTPQTSPVCARAFALRLPGRIL
jgi:hypothetical protein